MPRAGRLVAGPPGVDDEQGLFVVVVVVALEGWLLLIMNLGVGLLLFIVVFWVSCIVGASVRVVEDEEARQGLDEYLSGGEIRCF